LNRFQEVLAAVSQSSVAAPVANNQAHAAGKR
jgi:hypothetical protein